jgi:dihydrofolate reductase
MINMIVTVGKNGVIGKDKGLPWMLPAILKDIRGTVDGQMVIVGSNTFEFMCSLPFPGAIKTYVMSRRIKTPRIKGVSFIRRPNSVPHTGKKDIFVLGGYDTFQTFRPLVNGKLIVYNLHKDFEGDIRFPVLETLEEGTSYSIREAEQDIDLVSSSVVEYNKVTIDYQNQ